MEPHKRKNRRTIYGCFLLIIVCLFFYPTLLRLYNKHAWQNKRQQALELANKRGWKIKTIMIRDSVPIDFVYIPPGEFMMGSLPSGKGAQPCDMPRHKVKITQGFYMSMYEITQGQYEAVIGNNPSYMHKRYDFPVVYVNYNRATNFCKKLSRIANVDCELPTEAQWEYACRTGKTAKYDKQSKFHLNGVMSLAPNGFGLYGMTSNAYEWCRDVFSNNYYKYCKDKNIVDDPFNNKGDSFYRVCRGWGYYLHKERCRCSFRLKLPAGMPAGCIGFRVVISGNEQLKYNLRPSQ